jgi:hypothetical protein
VPAVNAAIGRPPVRFLRMLRSQNIPTLAPDLVLF